MNMKYVYEQCTHHRFNEPLNKIGKNRVKAIHYIQSFTPDPNLTPEQVHHMGLAFIRKAFGDNVQAVIATHVDKEHLHNHILINTYGIDGHKFNDNYTTRRKLRDISDRVCLAFGVPYIEPKHKRGMTYGEWNALRKGTSWKEKIKKEIDTLVLSCKNYDELAAALEERGYVFKYGTYTAIKAPEQKNFTRLKTLGEDYTIENIASRIKWKDDLGNASREDAYNKGQSLTICFAGIITQLAKRIVDGTKKPNKRDESLEYLPHNDRDIFQLSAQLALINRLHIHSISQVSEKIEEAQKEHDKVVSEFNALTSEHHRLADLLKQYDSYCELEDKPDKTMTEKMKLSLARQSLARHGIISPEDVRQLEIQKQDYDDRIAEIQRTINDKDYLVRALREISDTYYDISQGDYISKLIVKKKEQQETPPENIVQEKATPVPAQAVSALKQDEPRQETPKPVQKQDEPTQESPAQKPATQETHRRKKSR
ncbi:MAG: relaxase/mobilization nuclease domain-containing protein [Ruminiclostridium sp.]|nr:relaxase/mobilization nuclease domain-containing protein [Ruminiclostridium sp.]